MSQKASEGAVMPLEPFGVANQVLPGREGPIGFRIEL
jgi:hypothetical protein